jgi:hypothetical protein
MKRRKLSRVRELDASLAYTLPRTRVEKTAFWWWQRDLDVRVTCEAIRFDEDCGEDCAGRLPPRHMPSPATGSCGS